MVFRKRGNTRPDELWHYGGSTLEVVDNFNFLGTVFSYNGSFKVNQDLLVGKGLKESNVLLINLKKQNIKPSTQCQLFDYLVGSILHYASEVWGFGTIYNIEKVHLSFCKRILNVKTSTSTLAIYSKLGHYPLYANRYCGTIKYWCNIVQSNNIILKCIYAGMLKQLNNRNTNWLFSCCLKKGSLML